MIRERVIHKRYQRRNFLCVNWLHIERVSIKNTFKSRKVKADTWNAPSEIFYTYVVFKLLWYRLKKTPVCTFRPNKNILDLLYYIILYCVLMVLIVFTTLKYCIKVRLWILKIQKYYNLKQIAVLFSRKIYKIWPQNFCSIFT